MIVNIEDTEHWWTDNGHCAPGCPECAKENKIMTMTTRQEVYDAIDSERDYQDDLNDHVQTIGEEALMMNEYVARVTREWTNEFTRPEVVTLAEVRKLAAICVRCLEHHGSQNRNI